MNRQFRDDVYRLVSRIPKGRVMAYGQIAAICGSPNAARAVGQIAHFGPSDLPWHRVVNKKGVMASGFVPDGIQGQRSSLEDEGIKVVDDKIVNFSELLWQPKTLI
jgi:methylated-DNA-protein-cysteine methyltransferase-like protein